MSAGQDSVQPSEAADRAQFAALGIPANLAEFRPSPLAQAAADSDAQTIDSLCGQPEGSFAAFVRGSEKADAHQPQAVALSDSEGELLPPDYDGEVQPDVSGGSRGRPPLRPWQERFCAALAENKTYAEAAKAGNLSERQAWRWKASDKAFSEEWDRARTTIPRDIEKKGAELALAGDQKLIEFYLKTRLRAEYGDKLEVNVSGTLAHVDLSSDDVRRIVAEMHPELSPRALPSQSQG